MFRSGGRPMSGADAERFLNRPHVPPNTLRRILYNAPEPYKAQAWARMVASEDPSTWCGILYSANAEYRRAAAERMIDAKSGLLTVLAHAPAECRKRAAQVILDGEPTAGELHHILWYVAAPFRRQAWDLLRSDAGFRLAACDCATNMLTAPKIPRSYRAEAAEFLIAAGGDDGLEAVVARAVDPHRTIAARQLVERGEGLACVMIHVGDAQIREDAWAAFTAPEYFPDEPTPTGRLFEDVASLSARLPKEWRFRVHGAGRVFVDCVLERAAAEQHPGRREKYLEMVLRTSIRGFTTDVQRQSAAEQLLAGGPSRNALIAVAYSQVEPIASDARAQLNSIRRSEEEELQVRGHHAPEEPPAHRSSPESLRVVRDEHVEQPSSQDDDR